LKHARGDAPIRSRTRTTSYRPRPRGLERSSAGARGRPRIRARRATCTPRDEPPSFETRRARRNPFSRTRDAKCTIDRRRLFLPPSSRARPVRGCDRRGAETERFSRPDARTTPDVRGAGRQCATARGRTDAHVRTNLKLSTRRDAPDGRKAHTRSTNRDQRGESFAIEPMKTRVVGENPRKHRSTCSEFGIPASRGTCKQTCVTDSTLTCSRKISSTPPTPALSLSPLTTASPS